MSSRLGRTLLSILTGCSILTGLCAAGCSPQCDLASTLPGYVPQCEGAVLARYGDESRLVILGSTGGALVGYLPAPLEALPYGGTTGRSLTVIVDTDTDEFLALAPDAQVTVTDLGGSSATVDVSVDLDQGWVYGRTSVIVEQRD